MPTKRRTPLQYFTFFTETEVLIGGRSMSMKRRYSVAVLVSILFMVTSSIFINCSSQFSSQSAAALSGNSQINFSAGLEILRYTQKPNSITNLTNDVVRYEVVAGFQSLVDRVEYRLNNGDWATAYDQEIVLTSLSNGPQKISIRAISNTGSISEALDYVWSVDNISPQITTNSKPNAQIIELSTQVVFSVSEPVSSQNCQLNGVNLNNCVSPLMLTNLVLNTSYVLTIEVMDLAGNLSSTETVQFSVVPASQGQPSIIFSTKPSSPSGLTNPAFGFSEAGGGNSLVSFRCQLDAGASFDCVSGVQTSNLVEGQHQFAVTGFTSSGVASITATYSWFVDLTAPTIVLSPGIFEKYVQSVSETNIDPSSAAEQLKVGPFPSQVLIATVDNFGVSQVQCQLLRYKPSLKNCSLEPTPLAQAECQKNPYKFVSFEEIDAYRDCPASYVMDSKIPGGVYRLKIRARDLAGNQMITAGEFRIAESQVPIMSVHLSGGGALPGNFIVLDIDSNLLDAGGLDSTYGQWGIMPSTSFAPAMGIVWANESGILEGLNYTLLPSDQSKVKIFAIAGHSSADTSSNILYLGGKLEKLGLKGSYFQSIYNAENPGNASFDVDPTTKYTLNSLTDFDLLMPMESKANYDVRQSSQLASVWGVSSATAAHHPAMVQSAITQSVLSGLFGSGAIRLGGFDFDGSTPAITRAKDRAVGELLGRIIKSALIQNKKIFISLTGDGTTKGSSLSWLSDSTATIQVFMAVDPAAFSGYSLKNYMIGGFTPGNGSVHSASVAATSVEKAAAVMTCNYLAFAKKQNCNLSDIKNLLTADQVQSSTVIVPSAGN
jgi:hypothetical protein